MRAGSESPASSLAKKFRALAHRLVTDGTGFAYEPHKDVLEDFLFGSKLTSAGKLNYDEVLIEATNALLNPEDDPTAALCFYRNCWDRCDDILRRYRQLLSEYVGGRGVGPTITMDDGQVLRKRDAKRSIDAIFRARVATARDHLHLGPILARFEDPDGPNTTCLGDVQVAIRSMYDLCHVHLSLRTEAGATLMSVAYED